MAEPLDFQKKSSLERRCNKSVGFYALFGVLGGVCGVEKGYAFWSASVDPFWACRGARKKDMHFGARVWISMPFLSFLGKAAAEKGQPFRGFRTGMKKIVL